MTHEITRRTVPDQASQCQRRELIWFLIDLRQELNNRMVVSWDRLIAHRKSDQLMRELELPWIEFEYLPGYSMELNPYPLIVAKALNCR